MSAGSAILFDLGGTHLRCACMVRKDVFVNVTRERIRSFHQGLSSAAIWDEILENAARYIKNANGQIEQSAPVVISFPGPLNDDGRIVNAPTVTGVDEVVPDIRSELSLRTGRNVYVLNDVSAAAMYLAGQCRWERFMVVTISSGIGSKVCHRNSGVLCLFDKGPYAGEIGHFTVDPSENAPTCDCGGKGHLGAIASGRGVERAARQRAAADPASFARSLCHDRFGATAKTLNNEEHFVPAVRAGDNWALDVLEKSTDPLASVLNAVVLAVGLQGILIIGGFAFSIGPIYIDLLRELIRRRSDYSALEILPRMVQFGDMCEEASLRGAGEYALMLANKSS